MKRWSYNIPYNTYGILPGQNYMTPKKTFMLQNEKRAWVLDVFRTPLTPEDIMFHMFTGGQYRQYYSLQGNTHTQKYHNQCSSDLAEIQKQNPPGTNLTQGSRKFPEKYSCENFLRNKKKNLGGWEQWYLV